MADNQQLDFNNWHGTQEKMSGQSVDFGALLKQLIAPNAADPSTAQGNLGPATLSQLGKVGASTADAVGPYQQGVAKALKDLGQQHAQEAVASGMSPQDVQSHEIMQQQGQQSDIHPIIGALATMGLQQLASQQGNNQSQSTQQQTQQPAQKGQSVNPLSLLHNLVQGLVDVIPTSPEAKMANSNVAMNRQKMAAGLPAEIALPQAQANTAQANLAAGAPQTNVELTKQQIAESKAQLGLKAQEIKSGIYKTQSERQIQQVQRLTERRKQVLDQMNEDLQHGPIIGRGDRLREYRRQLNWYDNQINPASGIQPSNTPPPELVAAARKKGVIK